MLSSHGTGLCVVDIYIDLHTSLTLCCENDRCFPDTVKTKSVVDIDIYIYVYVYVYIYIYKP
jgi:hypothetical protein